MLSHRSLVGAVLTFLAFSTALGASCAMSSSSTEPSAVTAPPAISQIAPTGSPVGSRVTITGSGFAATGNHVKFGQGWIRNVSSSDGKTITFEVPSGLDLCAPDNLGPCPGGFPETRPGEYEVSVITNREASNTVTFTVTRQ
jgi:hypothetical protein